jgi:hypothetical protein
MEAVASSRQTDRTRVWGSLIVVVGIVLALLASTISVADAQTDQAVRPVQDVETLRLACAPDFINGQRGVLCKWSEATNPRTRAYQLYRITEGSQRELLTTVGADGRLAYFDTDVSAPSSLVYGVISLNRSGRLIGRSAPQHVQYGEDVQQLRMACAPDSIEGQRGVLCRWSETTQPTARGYLVYRSVGDRAREVIARIGLDGRQAHFDTNVVPGALHTYGVTAIDGDGNVVASGPPRQVRWPAAD